MEGAERHFKLLEICSETPTRNFLGTLQKVAYCNLIYVQRMQLTKFFFLRFEQLGRN